MRQSSLYETIVKADPNNVQYKFDLADVLSNLAGVQEKLGSLDDALATIDRALSISDAARAVNPKFTMHLFNYGGAILVRGEIQYKRGQLLDAVRDYQRGIGVYSEPGVIDRNPSVAPMAREGLGNVLVALARRDRSADRWREARVEFERALTGWNDIKAKGTLAATDAGKPAELEKRIAECDAALAGAGSR